MRFCVSANQSEEYLKKANEIIVQWENRENILDLIAINNLAYYTLILPTEELTNKDWADIKSYSAICKDKFFIKCHNENQLQEGQNKKIKTIPIYPVSDFFLLNALIEKFHIAGVQIAGEIVHNLAALKQLPIEIRVVADDPVVPYNYKPEIGSWFRPEDLYRIKEIDVCEFQKDNNIRREQSLFKIYAEDHKWNGALNMLIPDIINKDIMNRMIPSSFQLRRSNCNLKCQKGQRCHFCNSILYLANPKLLSSAKEMNND